MDNRVVVTVLGSCSGTEPQPSRHHTALTVEHGGALYWFDAGESCSHTAHCAGMDLPSTEAIFISHTHMDHIGGLPNLLWTLRKLASVSDEARRKLADRSIRITIPDLDVYEGVLAILRGTEGGFSTVFSLDAALCADGVVYDRNGMRVIALHNLHLGSAEPFKSFSFRIEVGSRSIVYSGDVKSISDIEGIIDKCDVLLMETGHHAVADICRYLKTCRASIGRLVFVHHGRAILRDPVGSLAEARQWLGDRVSIADDGFVVEL